jgi:hypothetical protein
MGVIRIPTVEVFGLFLRPKVTQLQRAKVGRERSEAVGELIRVRRCIAEMGCCGVGK